MNKILSSVIIAVAAGGILAGASGLIVAGGTSTDVANLKAAQPAIEQRLGAVEREVSGLKAATDERARADAEHRQRLDGKLGKLDGKLDRLLRRAN